MTLSLKSEKYLSAKKRINERVLRYYFLTLSVTSLTFLKGFFMIRNTTFVLCLFHTLTYLLNICKITLSYNFCILWNYTIFQVGHNLWKLNASFQLSLSGSIQVIVKLIHEQIKSIQFLKQIHVGVRNILKGIYFMRFSKI